MTVAQTLCVLPIGRSTLYQLIDEGQIPSIRVKTRGSRRGRILIRHSDLDTFIEKSRVGGAQ